MTVSSRLKRVLVGVVAAGLMASCGGTRSDAGRTGTGATTPGPAPAGASPAGTPGDPGQTNVAGPSPASGGTGGAPGVAGGTGGTGTGGTGTGTGTGTNGGGDGGVTVDTRPDLPTSTAFCAPARDLSDALGSVGAAQGPGDLEAAVAWARRSFATAGATALAELQGDVDELARAFGRLFDGMESVGYDRSRLQPDAFLGLTSERVTAAKERFNQYLANVC